MDILSSILLGITLAAPVGAVSIEMIKRGIKDGFWPCFSVHLGAVVADALYLVLIYFGLSPFLDNIVVKPMLFFVGALILCYLGYQAIKDYFRKINLKSLGSYSRKNSFLAGFVINAFNPYTIVWWISIFGATLSLATIERFDALLNGLAILLGVMVWGSFLSLAVAFSQKLITERLFHYVSLIAGIVLIGFSIYFFYNSFLSVMSLF